MAKTRTLGITVLADGRLFIDKRYLGVRIGVRVGAITQDQAEERLRVEMARIEYEQERKAHVRPTFADCAARYVAQSRNKRSIDVIKWHVQLLARDIGNLEPQQIHDATLEPFIKDRLAQDASATTINRTLEVVRTILNRAARSYRDADGRPWLDAMPPLISMLPENPRLPYPLTWKEQDELFRRLPTHLGRMALFAVNTGLRDSNVCGLQWTWEVVVPEIGRSVFVKLTVDEFCPADIAGFAPTALSAPSAWLAQGFPTIGGSVLRTANLFCRDTNGEQYEHAEPVANWREHRVEGCAHHQRHPASSHLDDDLAFCTPGRQVVHRFVGGLEREDPIHDLPDDARFDE